MARNPMFGYPKYKTWPGKRSKTGSSSSTPSSTLRTVSITIDTHSSWRMEYKVINIIKPSANSSSNNGTNQFHAYNCFLYHNQTATHQFQQPQSTPERTCY
ncbi:hypothetical protein Droror1_Dr00008418 [Drosera rotundifolia]